MCIKLRITVGVAQLLRSCTFIHVRCVSAKSPQGRMASKSWRSQGFKSRNVSELTECHLQVLGTGGNESAPSLCLFTNTKRYIFNCGENFQRLTTEYRLRTMRNPVLFTTGVTWRNLGGLIGFTMLMREGLKLSKYDLHGPQAVERFAEVGHRLISKENFTIATASNSGCPSNDTNCSNDAGGIYEDENLTVTTVELNPAQDYADVHVSSSDEDSADEGSEPVAKRMKRFTSSTRAAFVCKLVDVRGKFDPQKAKNLGLPPGPLYRELSSGKSVVAPNGQIIHPSDVLGTVRKGPVLIVLECPSEGYIPAITGNPMLAAETFTSSDQDVALVVHMSPLEVLQNDDYCKWMASFSGSTKHLILNEAVCPAEVGLRAGIKIQCLLHLLDQSIYHLPLTPKLEDHRNKLTKINQLLPQDSVIVGRTFLKYHLKPAHKIGVDESAVLKPVAEALEERLEEIKSNPTLLKAILPQSVQCATDVVDSHSKENPEPNDKQIVTLPPVRLQPSIPELTYDDALLTFLGTASAGPSQYRNVSGILLQTPTSGNVMLDCGEGSLSQIYRCFGKQLGDQIILNLNVVFISHIHADHHLGLLSVLQRKEELLKEKGADAIALRECRVCVILPIHNIRWLRAYNTKCERVSFKYIDCRTLIDPEPSTALRPYLTDLKFQTVRVIHCSEAYGVVIRHSSGWSIVYSGDTRPCADLVSAGQGASLLIHESTFEDGLTERAKESKHCTASEALQIAAQMNPGFTMLTHFSQRYSKLPSLAVGQLDSRVGIAFDCMSVRLKELHNLGTYLPAVNEILAEFSDTDDTDFVLPPHIEV